VLRGTPVDCLVERGIETDASLIICGSRGHGPWRSGVFGSVGRALAGQACSSVLIARQAQATRVLLASDGSPTAFAAEQAVMTWPAFASLPIDLVRVDHADSHLPWRAQPAPTEECGPSGWTVARLQACGRHASETHLVGEPARKVLCHAADSGADLIVVGTHDRSRFGRLWHDSVAAEIAARGSSSVLIARDCDLASEQRRGGTPIRVRDLVFDTHPHRPRAGSAHMEV
jgi:nucleotide-binding universal stress UspA family protein